ncbi:MAG TPA: serine/threonine-protein kinase, partial [Polyangiaceae bacterium]|nr:serine/threonine-protein kinase [Polyangiaceae bacterium]
MIGKVLDSRYRIDKLLGQGGMGAVYEATHTGTGRRVAVKLIQQIALGDTDVFARFQREARASSAVDTRHIVEVLDSGRDPETGLPYMAMEMLKGEDVGAYIARRGPMPISLALRVTAQACLGLAKAHHADVVHRDIKPANLFLTEEEDDEVIVKILDFGIAKVRPKTPLEGEGLALTQTGRLLGTPLYMSPEQAQGMKDIDHRTDLWSLGAVLFEALTGAPPFDAENLGRLILAICSKPVRTPSSISSGISPELDAIVTRAMKTDRDDRYPNADAMFEDLMTHLPDGYAISVPELRGETGRPPAIRRTAGSGVRIPVARPSEGGGPLRITPPRAPKNQELIETRPLDEAEAVAEVGVASTLYASVSALPSPRRRAIRRGVAALAVLSVLGGGLVAWRVRASRGDRGVPAPSSATALAATDAPTATVAASTEASAPVGSARDAAVASLPASA